MTGTTARTFAATVQVDARGQVSVTIPFDPAAEWGRRQRHHVRAALNGTVFEGSLGVRGGRVFLPLAKPLRESAGIAPGDTVELTLEPIDQQTERLPAELSEALDGDAAAKAFFETLSGFQRRQHAAWIDGAKQPQTRQRRTAEVVELLRQRRPTR